jgi:hypothetical protein
MGAMKFARWRRALLRLAIACMALAASQLAFDADPSSAATDPANLPVDPAEGRATFGLSCGQCQHITSGSCQLMARSTIVAVVRGARVTESFGECSPQEPRPNDSSFCSSRKAVQFASVQFLRNELNAAPSDRFFSMYSFEYWKPDKKRGIYLDPDKRYVIFAGEHNQVVPPKARWLIESACEVWADAPFPPP